MARATAAIQFPDPRTAGDDGLLCYGGDLKVETLLQAYGRGIFPWPQEGLPMLWFSPLQRGILDFGELHWPSRFLREVKSKFAPAKGEAPYKITFDRDFPQVIHECSAIPRSHETGTWIVPEIEDAYQDFHKAGFAHSVECWSGDRLIGGLYGVYVHGVFSGESMFYKERDASKFCLYALVQKLQAMGLKWMDIQMVTPVLQTFGGKYISRGEFLERLRIAQIAPPALSLK
jgi:leucyl/phenylalanyl-tRNA---protein transferase